MMIRLRAMRSVSAAAGCSTAISIGCPPGSWMRSMRARYSSPLPDSTAPGSLSSP